MGGVREGSISKEEHLHILELHDMEMRRAMRDSVVGAIQDLIHGEGTVQVHVRWSKEFYDRIMETPDA